MNKIMTLLGFRTDSYQYGIGTAKNYSTHTGLN